MIPKKKLGNSYNLTNNMSLPYINNSSKKFMLKSNFKKNLIDSSIKAQKYKLDVKRYTYNLNSKKKILDSLKKECERIILSCRKIITKAIESGGTTIRSYTSSLGVTGRFQQHLKVHKRENEACYNCSSIIKKEYIGGRSTYYCPKCQK